MNLFLLLLFLTLSAVGGPFETKSKDRLEDIARPYRFNIVTWEVKGLLAEGVQQLQAALPGGHLTESEERALVSRHEKLREDIASLKARIAALPASGGQSEERERLQGQLSEKTKERERMRERVEIAIGRRVGRELVSEGLVMNLPLGVGPSVVFPPVSFQLATPPSVFAVSPRDRIKLEKLVVLRPNLSSAEAQAVESKAESEGWSTLVEPTGGYSTYPTMVPSDTPLDFLVSTIVHEWLHGYLFFRPLGWNYYRSPEMRGVNETVADMGGSEIGGRVLQWYRDGSAATRSPESDRAINTGRQRFDFRREMRETRLAVDEMLAQGRTDDAEFYMELRRRFLAEHGYYIRKLNQAYFAFHGVYGDSPASVSPIGGYLQRLRADSPSVGEFVKKVSHVSSYQEFLELVGER